MKTYARIDHGSVAELLVTQGDPAHLYHAALVWREVTTPGVAIGWLAGPMGFVAPPAPEVRPALAPSLAELQSDLAILIARVAAFTSHTGV